MMGVLGWDIPTLLRETRGSSTEQLEEGEVDEMEEAGETICEPLKASCSCCGLETDQKQ
jgi:hypothetical protein